MADALVLSVEEKADAIVDIATLTGAAMRALGDKIAGLFGNNQDLLDQVRDAAKRTDEPVWNCRWTAATASSSTPRSRS